MTREQDDERTTNMNGLGDSTGRMPIDEVRESIKVAVAKPEIRTDTTAGDWLEQAGRTFAQLTNLVQRWWVRLIQEQECGIGDVHANQPFFWMGLYNTALLEPNGCEASVKTLRAQKAIESRKRFLHQERTTGAEWNLLQYAAIVLQRIARNREEPGGCLSTFVRMRSLTEKKAAQMKIKVE